MAMSDEDMAEYQRLSNDYVPDIKGPSVGQRQPIQAITAEYAQADPIYVHKTRALPQKYSHYRTVKGDGNCGWRALAYGYFELLIRLGDPSRVLAEKARLLSMNNLLNSVDYYPDMYDEFVEETLKLLDQTAASLPCHDDGAALLETFNDEGLAGPIIYHFRLMTSAWMKTHEDYYQPFLPNLTVDQYRRAKLEPFAQEIEHIGVDACINAVIKPAGMAVEVLYLDRSPGDEANEHRWQPAADVGFLEIPTFRLLYRPGHYDLLYKPEDTTSVPSIPVVSAAVNPQINFVSDHPAFVGMSNTIYMTGGLDLNECFLPGLSLSGITQMPYSTSGYPQDPAFAPVGLPMSPPSVDPYSVPMQSFMHTPPIERPSDSSFRPSKFQIEMEYRQLPTVHPEPCQTEAMKQAGESPAHYKNKEFQPQIWEPGAEYNSTGRSSESYSRRSS